MFSKTRAYIPVLILCCILSACSTKKRAFLSDDALNWESFQMPSVQDKVHTLYLIGDAGRVDNKEDTSNYVVHAMTSMMDLQDKNSTVVYLGDNVYPVGLASKEDEAARIVGENILHAQFYPLRNYVGETYVIPGNHDWNKDNVGGLEAVKRQEDFIESEFGSKGRVHFYPNMGCGDPEVVKINKEVVYIFIDSQWWLHNWKYEKKINEGCEIRSRGDLLQRMEELFLKYKNKEIICILHHPIKSNGNHGGYFTLKQHIFPLGELGFWFPLPIIGSIYPIYRQATGSTQDNTNIHNQKLTKGLETLAKKHRLNVVFASGHEHGLEYYETGKIKYIVSGSGSKATYIQAGGEAVYARQARGFARIHFFKHFESWIEFYTVKGFDSEPVLEYRTQLRAPRAGTVEDKNKYPSIVQKDTIVAANPSLNAGGFKKMMLGKQYRDMWSIPVKAEIVDLETKYGGLIPIKKGGGMSSNSLRMQHESGKQYILRSIKKDYRKLVPEEFENLKVLDIMKDQNSASHPYGALAIPPLSKAAGIFYTHPKLVYLKHQKGLGNYNSQFPEELYLLEERPSGNWSDDPKFGNADDIIGYTHLLANLRTKKHHIVDQKWVLKSRIFDLWIHDWDRHDDQWRWAKFKEGEETIYRPIPRDRDQVFYKFVGLVPTLVSAFILKKFKTMKHNVKDVKNLSFNAQHFDRHFLNELEWSEWKSIIAKLQENLTDEVIDKAMLEIPEAVHHTDNADIASKLKSRRGHLQRFAKELYDFLSEEVEIVGTDHNDKFIVDAIDKMKTRVRVYTQRKNKGDILKYERNFSSKETKEIRLYGLRGKDKFEFNGTNNSAFDIKIIGGEDEDEVINNISKSNISVFDEPDGIKTLGKVNDKTSTDYQVNQYDRNGFKYNTDLPILNFGYTQDDGMWIGGGYTWTTFGWRKSPYKSKNLVSLSIAPGGQNAIQFDFKSDNVDVMGKLDLIPELTINFPRYENYFGLGNNSINPRREVSYNWVKLQSIDAKVMAKANLTNASYFLFGPVFQSIDVNLSEGRVGDDPILGFSGDDLDRRNYLGINIAHQLKFVDNNIFPSNGFKFNVSFANLREVKKKENVIELDIGSRAYIMLYARPKIILANAFGYKKRWGDLQFHQYADLGNKSNLRGYRNNRFRGESIFYHNMDLRLHLLNWNNTWLPMEIGLLGGFDYGRAWLKDEASEKWHNSSTVGIWMNVLNLAVIQPHYSFVGDGEGDVFTLLLGFNF